MPDNFQAGESDADTGAPPYETMGARYGIHAKLPQTGRGAHEQQVSNYTMPSIHGRNGSMERVDAAITQTPLGGMMPGPLAIAPAVMAGNVGAFPCSDDGQFKSGVIDGWPEGPPVPIR